MNMVRSTIPSTRGRSSIDTPRKFFDSYPDFDINSVNSWDVWASSLLWPCKNITNARKRQRWSLSGCLFMSDKRQFTEWFSVKVQARQSPDIPLGCFFSSAARIVIFVINLNLHFVFWHSCVYCSTISNFFDFFLDCNQIRFRTQ